MAGIKDAFGREYHGEPLTVYHRVSKSIIPEMVTASTRGPFEHCGTGSCMTPFYCHCTCFDCRELRIAAEIRKDCETLARRLNP